MLTFDEEMQVDPKILEPLQGPNGNAFFHMGCGGSIRIFTGDARFLQRRDEQWICFKCARTWYADQMRKLNKTEYGIRFGVPKQDDLRTYVLMYGHDEESGKYVHKMIWFKAKETFEKLGWKVARPWEWEG